MNISLTKRNWSKNWNSWICRRNVLGYDLPVTITESITTTVVLSTEDQVAIQVIFCHQHMNYNCKPLWLSGSKWSNQNGSILTTELKIQIKNNPDKSNISKNLKEKEDLIWVFQWLFFFFIFHERKEACWGHCERLKCYG